MKPTNQIQQAIVISQTKNSTQTTQCPNSKIKASLVNLSSAKRFCSSVDSKESLKITTCPNTHLNNSYGQVGNQVSQTPLHSHQESIHVLADYQPSNDIQIKDQTTDLSIEQLIAELKSDPQHLGWQILIKQVTGLIYHIHKQYLQSHMSRDDWYSEGLIVLMKSVDKYAKQKAKFTTYYHQGLHNRAIDIIRKNNSPKYSQVIASLDYLMIDADGDESFLTVADTTKASDRSEQRELMQAIRSELGKKAEQLGYFEKVCGYEQAVDPFENYSYDQARHLEYRIKQKIKGVLTRSYDNE